MRAIEEAVIQAGFGADVVPAEVACADHAGFAGSPTVLVNGRDVSPASRTMGMSCRLHETPDGRGNAPTAAMIRTTIGEEKRAQAEAR